MKNVHWILLVALCAMTGRAYAYTPAETNDVVRGMLFHVVHFYSHDNFPDDNGIVVPGPAPDTWDGFFGTAQEGRWTAQEKRCAFDWYLSTLGTNDFSTARSMEKNLLHAAITRCEALCYTNSVPHLRALALNPKGHCRLEAIELSLKFSPVSDASTSFIETIMTNVVGFTSVERGIACAVYADQLRLYKPTNAVETAAKARGVQMFYRNRNLGYDSAYLIDELFVSSIDGYAASSNRLETALSMLRQMEPDDIDRKDFIAITNQLLSSGQPLRWVNFGGTNE